jgi:hypothetical protein
LSDDPACCLLHMSYNQASHNNPLHSWICD